MNTRLLAQADSIKNIFGTVKPPEAVQQFVGSDTTGAAALSTFISNLIALIYIVAGIVFIFFIIWGAWDWLTSAGEKEKIAAAQKKLINAFIGIVLFAIAFAVITIIGIFTGFEFYKGQSDQQLIQDANLFKQQNSFRDRPGPGPH